MSRIIMLAALLLSLGGIVAAGAQPAVARDADTGRAGRIKAITDEQRGKIAAIVKDAGQQIFAVLTPEQQQQLKTLAGEAIDAIKARFTGALAGLQLTAEQRAKIDAIQRDAAAKAAKVRADAALTPADRQQQLRAILQEARRLIGTVLTREQRQQFAAVLRDGGKADPEADRYRELDLTPEQAAKLKAVLDAARQQLQAIRDNAGLTAVEKRRQAAEVTRNIGVQVGQFLTPEQQQKLHAQIAVRRGGWARFGADVLKQLNLTPEQQEKVQTIKAKAAAEIRALLDPRQQKAFDRFDAGRQDQFLQQFDAPAPAKKAPDAVKPDA